MQPKKLIYMENNQFILGQGIRAEGPRDIFQVTVSLTTKISRQEAETKLVASINRQYVYLVHVNPIVNFSFDNYKAPDKFCSFGMLIKLFNR